MAASRQVAEKQYSARDIQVLEGLEAVRRRPGMYIGGTDQRGLHHLLIEIADNSIDEAMAGHCDRIWIHVARDGTVSVRDNGWGIPIDTHPRTGKSALETVMTVLHAGGKFGGQVYKVSGGLHGVGASVVNALSERMWVEVRRSGKLYRQEYERGVPTTPVRTVKESLYRGIDVKDLADTGTTSCFLPDKQIFGELAIDAEQLVQRFREYAYLTKGIWLSFVDEMSDTHLTFYFEGGIQSFVRHLNKDREVLFPRPIYVERELEGTTVECAIQYNNTFNEATFSFANCINTIDGGSHMTGFRSALTRVLNDYARKQKYLKDDDANLTGEDVREGLTAVVSVKLPEPQFEGQTKTRLGNPEVKGLAESAIADGLSQYLEEHPGDGRRIIEKCITAAHAREAARKARDLVIRKGLLDGTLLPGKLADCSDRDPENCEIFIVEGPSAGGSAKAGRDRRNQAILPLQGKILNVERARLDRVFGHAEIAAIIKGLGTGIDDDFDLSKLRYHRVIIMTDADVDGAHIRTLLLTLFFRHMRPLIDGGHLYIAQPPLYLIKHGRASDWIFTEDDKEKWVADRAYRDLKIFSTKNKVELSGAALYQKLGALRSFDSWERELSRVGLSPSTAEILIQGTDKFTFKTENEMQALVAFLRTSKVNHNSITDYDASEFSVEIAAKSNDGTAFDIRKLAQSSTLARCFSLAAAVRDIVKGEKYTIMKRDRTIATDVVWHQLSHEIGRAAEGGGISFQRFKGLGEMNAEQLWETTMDPATRILLQVNVEDAMRADTLFSNLMGDDVAPRKAYIQAHAASVRNLDV